MAKRNAVAKNVKITYDEAVTLVDCIMEKVYQRRKRMLADGSRPSEIAMTIAEYVPLFKKIGAVAGWPEDYFSPLLSDYTKRMEKGG